MTQIELKALLASVEIVQLTLSDVIEAINAGINSAGTTAPAPAAPAPVPEIKRTLHMLSACPWTYEELSGGGWTDEALVASNHAEWVGAEAEVLPEVPATEMLNAVGVATGFTYDQYIGNGWSDESLIANGYMDPVMPEAPTPPAPLDSPDDWGAVDTVAPPTPAQMAATPMPPGVPAAAAAPTAPIAAQQATQAFQRVDGGFTDVWDIELPFDDRIHGKSKNAPKINADGRFARRRNVDAATYTAVVEGLNSLVLTGVLVSPQQQPVIAGQAAATAPAAPTTARSPTAPQAPAAPKAAPVAPTTATAPVTTPSNDDNMADLENKLANW